MMNTGESAFGKGGAQVGSPRRGRKSAALGNFSEGNFYKQVVSFQSNRGQLYNDSAIVKNSITQAQRRCDRQAFMKAKMDIAHAMHQGSKVTTQSGESKAGSPAVKTPANGQ